MYHKTVTHTFIKKNQLVTDYLDFNILLTTIDIWNQHLAPTPITATKQKYTFSKMAIPSISKLARQRGHLNNNQRFF